jgi:phenol 2-monooxygenase
MIEKVHVLICGSRSAGLCAATWIARHETRFKVLERREGPLALGQADGVQLRTNEFCGKCSIADEPLREASHVLEAAFIAEQNVQR